MGILDKNHNDWPWPLSLIPRRWTAIPSDKTPHCIAHSGPKGCTDLPEPGFVLAWPPYFAVTTAGGWHFRIGARYDYVDKYYEVPSLALKKVK